MIHDEIRNLTNTITTTLGKSTPEEFKAHITAKNNLHALLMNNASKIADLFEKEDTVAKPVNTWREAVIGELCVWNCLPDNVVDDPQAALQLLLKLEREMALDPKVSEDADTLLNRGHTEGAQAMKIKAGVVILQTDSKPLNNRGAAAMDISRINVAEVVDKLKGQVFSYEI
jgi:hypothetical protein